jgi:N-acetyl-anhydromuramyl-L-alanine amidase AmpD
MSGSNKLPLTVNDTHWIDGVAVVPTKNITASPEVKPKYIIFHGTVLPLEALLTHFSGQDDITKESAHLYIAEDGTIAQFAPFNVKTWHAGVSYWQGHHGLNGFSIGVYVQHAWTDENTIVSHDLTRELVSRYNVRDVLSHTDVCTRKHCQHVDVSYLKPYVDYGNADSIGRFITTSDLAVRGGPNVQFEIVDRILSGDGVKVLRYSRDEEWAFVLYNRASNSPKHGWVHESFLRRL